ncbi:MAG: aminotransferase DegT [Legionellales bacterium]|nr:aminotransferase DegT [Legionellales bacterium]|tara:strand:- start:21126 stop:22238 length:1113 start_codon:yes stop_codon:yes gene_type:complete
MIPVFKPLIAKEERKAADRSLEIGWLGMGKFVKEFEDRISKIIGNKKKYVVAVNTGHSALHLIMLLLGLKKGDEVITPSFNNIADIQAIHAAGAKAVFCDVDEQTLCIDPKKAEKLINKKTKAIIAMDYGSCIADHDAVKKIAKKHKIRVIHDAAHSLGSKYKGKLIGSFSDVAMFSFDPVKTFTSIDGGAIVVNTKQEMLNLHEMRLMGMSQKANIMYKNQRAWFYDVKNIGYRYHLANLHAAIGVEQLKKIKKIKKSRINCFKRYNTKLKNIKSVITPKYDLGTIPFHYCLRVKNNKRYEMINYLKSQGIDTGIHWQPNHTFSIFRKNKSGDLSVTNKIKNEILTLPLHSMMKKKDIDYIVSKIKNFF